ncbi:MAG: carbohydrate ABC transporter permease [Marvinbryantia sp.]|jgi:putative aldouronate transport system permease protein
MKPTKGQKVFAIFNYIFLSALALLCLLPMLNILALSLSSRNMVNAGAVTLWPKEFTLSAYTYMLQKSGLVPALLVTLKRLVLGLALNLSMTILVAYPLSKSEKYFKSRKFYVVFFLITMVFNGGIIPTYLVIKELKMLDTLWALILPNSVTMFYVLLMLNFFRGIPEEIEEAAIVDGAGWLTVLLKIYLPLSLPSLATITLFIIVGHWNEWFDGMIYNNHAENYPLMTFLQYHVLNFKTSDLRPEQIAANPALADLEGRAIKSAGIMLCTLPVLIFYPFLQKYFVTGITVGSVKS